MEQQIHILIDSRFGALAASTDLNRITAMLVECATKESGKRTLVNPGAYRIVSVPDVTTVPVKDERGDNAREGHA